MLPLVFAGVIFLFLLIGSVVFLACLLVAPIRWYALSAALWCAVWGPCSILLMVIAGVGLVAAAFIEKTGDLQTIHAPKLLSTFGWAYLIAGIIITILFATASAWVHQVLTRSFTFPLFRLYATGVTSGIGSVFGWCIGWWLMLREMNGYIALVIWAASMMVLIASFGLVAYKWAHLLRGEAPKGFTWISSD